MDRMTCYACDSPAVGICQHRAHAPACPRHATHKGIGTGWGLTVRGAGLRARDRARRDLALAVHSVLRPEREGAPRHERGVDGGDRAGSGVSQ